MPTLQDVANLLNQPSYGTSLTDGTPTYDPMPGVPLNLQGDAIDLADGFALRYWGDNPQGSYSDFQQKFAQYAASSKVPAGWIKSIQPYAKRSYSIYGKAFRDLMDSEVNDTTRPYESRSYNYRSGNDLRLGMKDQNDEVAALNRVKYLYRDVPSAAKELAKSNPKIASHLQAAQDGNQQARRLVEEQVREKANAKEQDMRFFDRALSDQWGPFWDNAVLRSGIRGIGNFATNMTSLGARLVGADETADSLQRRTQELSNATAAAQDRQEVGGVGRWLENAATSAVENVAMAATGGMLARGASATAGVSAGLFGANSANQAVTSGREAGLKGTNLARYAATQGLAEGGVSYVFGKILGPGLEGMFGKKAAAKAAENVFGQFGKELASEIPEEVSTELIQRLSQVAHNIDPQALSSEELPRAIADVVGQTVVTMGLAATIRDSSNRVSQYLRSPDVHPEIRTAMQAAFEESQQPMNEAVTTEPPEPVAAEPVVDPEPTVQPAEQAVQPTAPEAPAAPEATPDPTEPVSPAAQFSLEAWITQNRAAAEVIAQSENPSRKDFEQAGLPIQTNRKGRIYVARTIKQLLNSPLAADPKTIELATPAVQQTVEPQPPIDSTATPVEAQAVPQNPAFGQELAGTEKVIRSVGRKLGMKPKDLDDLVGNTFAQAIQTQGQFKPDKGNLSAWVGSIAKTEAMRMMRYNTAKKRTTPTIAIDPTTGPDVPTNQPAGQYTGQQVDIATMRAEIAKLPDNQRIAIEGMLDGKSTEAIAAELKISAKSVKRYQQQGQDSLRQILNVQPGDGDDSSRTLADADDGSGFTPQPTTTSGSYQPIPPPLMYQYLEKVGAKLFAKKLKPGLRGQFVRSLFGDHHIDISEDTIANEKQFAKTLGHEIGHLKDTEGDPTVDLKKDRGNLGGHITAMRNFVSTMINNPATGSSYSVPVLTNELSKLSEWWRGSWIGTSQKNIRYRTYDAEFYGDAISVLMNAPSEFQARAPEAWKAIFEYMPNRDQFAEFYERAQIILRDDDLKYETYRDVFSSAYASADAKVLAAHAARVDAQQRTFGELVQHLFVSFKKLTTDKYALTAKRAENLGRMNDMAVIEQMHRTGTRTASFLADVKAEIDNRINDSGISRDDLGMYLQGMRIAYGDRAKVLNIGAMTPTEAQFTLEKLMEQLGPKKWKELVDIADRSKELWFDAAEEMYESGLFTDEQIDMIRKNKNYAPVAVSSYLDRLSLPPSIKQQHGTAQENANPYVATILKSIGAIRAIDYNNGARAAVRVAMEETRRAGRRWLAVPANKIHEHKLPAGKKWLEYAVDGKWVAAAVDTEIADEITQSSNSEPVFKALNRITYSIFHPLYVSANPNFWLSNMQRDASVTFVNLNNLLKSVGAKPISLAEFAGEIKNAVPIAKDIAFGVWSVRARDQLQDRVVHPQLLLETLGSNETYKDVTNVKNPVDLLMLQHGIKKPERNGRGVFGATWDAVTHNLAAAAATVEMTSKIASNNILKSRGFNDQALRSYYVNTFTGTPDTSSTGTMSSATNYFAMYGKVFLNGLFRTSKMWTDPKYRKANAHNYFKYLAVPRMLQFSLRSGVLLSLYAAARGLKEDDEGDEIHQFLKWNKRAYDKMSNYQIKHKMAIPIASYTDDKGNEQFVFMGFAVDQNLLPATVALDYALEAMFDQSRYAGKEDQFNQFANDMLGMFIPGEGPMQNIAGVLASYASGHQPIDKFSGRAIGTRREWEAGGAERLRPIASWVGDQFGVLSNLTAGVRKSLLGTPYENEDRGHPTWVNVLDNIRQFGLRQVVGHTEGALTQQQKAQRRADDQWDAAFGESIPQTAQDLSRMLFGLRNTPPEVLSRDPHAVQKQIILNDWFSEYRNLYGQLKRAEKSKNEPEAKRLRELLDSTSASVQEAIQSGEYEQNRNYQEAVQRLRKDARIVRPLARKSGETTEEFRVRREDWLNKKKSKQSLLEGVGG